VGPASASFVGASFRTGRRIRGEPAEASEILEAAQEPRLAYYPVPKAVGSPKNDAPNLVEPIA